MKSKKHIEKNKHPDELCNIVIPSQTIGKESQNKYGDNSSDEKLNACQWFDFDFSQFMNTLFPSFIVCVNLIHDLYDKNFIFLYLWAQIDFITLNLIFYFVWFGYKKWLSAILIIIGLLIDFLPIPYYLILQESILLPHSLIYSFLIPISVVAASCIYELLFYFF